MSQASKEYKRAWRLKNKEKLSIRAAIRRTFDKEKMYAQTKALFEKNKERYLIKKREWTAKNAERVREYKRKHAAANPQCARANSAARRARRLEATPKWLTLEQRRLIRKIYRECPSGYEVDHIVPLRGKEVHGLHVPWNLQYLTKEENRKKRNRVV